MHHKKEVLNKYANKYCPWIILFLPFQLYQSVQRHKDHIFDSRNKNSPNVPVYQVMMAIQKNTSNEENAKLKVNFI